MGQNKPSYPQQKTDSALGQTPGEAPCGGQATRGCCARCLARHVCAHAVSAIGLVIHTMYATCCTWHLLYILDALCYMLDMYARVFIACCMFVACHVRYVTYRVYCAACSVMCHVLYVLYMLYVMKSKSVSHSAMSDFF